MKKQIRVRATALLFLLYSCGALLLAGLLRLGFGSVFTLPGFVLVLFTILAATDWLLRVFQRQIADCIAAMDRERRTVFEEATKQLFDHIYEVDLTRNRPADEGTAAFFESVGVPRGTPYDQALRFLAQTFVKEEFRQGILDTFAPEQALRAYREGRRLIRNDSLMSSGEEDTWVRLIGRIVAVQCDGSIHMMVYQQNIDREKRQERRMLELAHTDGMTDLLNKGATERSIRERMREEPDQLHALFLFDIDHFKQANDIHGHAFGDAVIIRFAATIRELFRKGDIIGRIGGDEFAAFIPAPDRAWTEKKACELVEALSHIHRMGEKSWRVSTSMGIAFFPTDAADYDSLFEIADGALYETKARGRNGFTVYAHAPVNSQSHRTDG